MLTMISVFFFYCYGDNRDLHVLTHSFPTRLSSDLDDFAQHGGLVFGHGGRGEKGVPARRLQIDTGLLERGHIRQRRFALLPRGGQDTDAFTLMLADRKSTRLNSRH